MQTTYLPGNTFIQDVFEKLSDEKSTDGELERVILESYAKDMEGILDLIPGLEDLSLKDFSEKTRLNPESFVKVKKELFFKAVGKFSKIGSIGRLKRTETAIKRLPKLISIVGKYTWQSLQMYQSEKFKKSLLGAGCIQSIPNPTMKDFPILLMLYFDMREFVQIIKIDGSNKRLIMDVEFLNNFQKHLDKLF